VGGVIREESPKTVATIDSHNVYGMVCFFDVTAHNQSHSLQAVQDDASQCFRAGQKNDVGRGIKLTHYKRNCKVTLYGRKFGLMFMDEAHAG